MGLLGLKERQEQSLFISSGEGFGIEIVNWDDRA